MWIISKQQCGIFPKNWEFSKTIREHSLIYFGEYLLNISNFPRLLWKFAQHISGNISYKLGNFRHHILGNISQKLGIFRNYCKTFDNYKIATSTTLSINFPAFASLTILLEIFCFSCVLEFKIDSYRFREQNNFLVEITKILISSKHVKDAFAISTTLIKN